MKNEIKQLFKKLIPLEAIGPPAEIPEVKYIDVTHEEYERMMQIPEKEDPFIYNENHTEESYEEILRVTNDKLMEELRGVF